MPVARLHRLSINHTPGPRQMVLSQSLPILK
jgi:hypothetical protein